MKLKRWIVLPLVFLMGCASLTPDRVNLLVAIAGAAAQIGTAVYLQKHPEHRDLFNIVLFELGELAKAGITTTNNTPHVAEMAAVERLNFLPTSTLEGPDGAVYIATADIVIWDGRKAVTVDGPATAPVIQAIRGGLKRALAPLPPAPVPTMPNRVHAPRGLLPE